MVYEGTTVQVDDNAVKAEIEILLRMTEMEMSVR